MYTKSKGEVISMKGNYKHGGANTRLYDIWKHMRSRCHRPSDPKYYRYGERGITICSEWDDFSNFRDWALQNGYSDKLSIDRIDNDGNYEPSNCKWSTNKEQANNRGYRCDTPLITWGGETHSLVEWSKLLNIKYKTLAERYRRGWKVPKLFEEVNKYGGIT